MDAFVVQLPKPAVAVDGGAKIPGLGVVGSSPQARRARAVAATTDCAKAERGKILNR
jgi:hypothetical protein